MARIDNKLYLTTPLGGPDVNGELNNLNSHWIIPNPEFRGGLAVGIMFGALGVIINTGTKKEVQSFLDIELELDSLSGFPYARDVSPRGLIAKDVMIYHTGTSTSAEILVEFDGGSVRIPPEGFALIQLPPKRNGNLIRISDGEHETILDDFILDTEELKYFVRQIEGSMQAADMSEGDFDRFPMTEVEVVYD